MDIAGSTDCKVQASLPVNPGISDTFPWLSGIADKYDQYKLSSLEFEYVPVKGTDISGEIGLLFDPDTLDDPPLSMSELLQSQYSITGAPWRGFKLGRLGGKNTKFTRAGHPVAIDTDLKTYDAGRIHVVTCGMVDTSNVGYLMVHYTVELIHPQTAEIASTAGQFPHTAKYSLISNYHNTEDDTSYHTMDTSLFSTDMDVIGITKLSTGFRLPPGQFRITASVAHQVRATAAVGHATSRTRLAEAQSNEDVVMTYVNTASWDASSEFTSNATQIMLVNSTAAYPAVVSLDVYRDADITGGDSVNLLVWGTTNILIEQTAVY